MQAASILIKRAVIAATLLCGVSAHAAASNDPDLLGAWKGTGADAQWVVNFMPNDTYQFRLGDSPSGSRGEYVAHNGKFELHDYSQKNKVLSGSYRLEDCNVLVLTLPTGTARMNRRGSIPTGGCGKGKAPSATAPASGGVFGSLGMGATANSAAAVTAPPAATTPGASPRSIAVPDASKAAASAKSSTQKSAQQSATAAKATAQQATTSAAAEGTNAVKSGATAFWTKARELSKSAVQAGGKAAKTVGTKAQEAGKAVAKTFKGAAEQADSAADEAAAAAKNQGN